MPNGAGADQALFDAFLKKQMRAQQQAQQGLTTQFAQRGLTRSGEETQALSNLGAQFGEQGSLTAAQLAREAAQRQQSESQFGRTLGEQQRQFNVGQSGQINGAPTLQAQQLAQSGSQFQQQLGQSQRQFESQLPLQQAALTGQLGGQETIQGRQLSDQLSTTALQRQLLGTESQREGQQLESQLATSALNRQLAQSQEQRAGGTQQFNQAASLLPLLSSGQLGGSAREQILGPLFGQYGGLEFKTTSELERKSLEDAGIDAATQKALAAATLQRQLTSAAGGTTEQGESAAREALRTIGGESGQQAASQAAANIPPAEFAGKINTALGFAGTRETQAVDSAANVRSNGDGTYTVALTPYGASYFRTNRGIFDSTGKFLRAA